MRSSETDIVPEDFARGVRGYLPALDALAHGSRAGWGSAAAMLKWLAAPEKCARPDLDGPGPLDEGWAEALALDARACVLLHDWDRVAKRADRLQESTSPRARRWA